MDSNFYKGIFKNRYPELKGSNWLSKIAPEDRQFFIKEGQKLSDYGRIGGRVRAQTGNRDAKGRFCK